MSARAEFLDTLRARARRRPDALALRTDGEAVSYGEFVARIDVRAAELTRAGIGPQDRVAVVADNSVEYLVSAFGVWACGAVLVTIYPSSGESDLTYCLTSSAPAAVLVSARLLDTVRSLAGPSTPVHDIALPLPDGTCGRRTTPPQDPPEDLALICYTSGSTDRPKAVMHLHTRLYAAASEFARVWRVSPEERTVVCLPMAWAFGLVTTSMTTLLAGGTVLPLPRTRPEALIRAITEHRATFLAGVTTIYAKLVDHVASLPAPPDLSSLRLCVTGGEPRNERIFDEWVRHGGRPVHDNFAASECFPVITYDPVADPQPRSRSAGYLVPGARMRLVDPDSGADVGPRGPGEALWQGPALFAGYWNDPQATARAFTPDGWYRTKDLVRVDQDGYVFAEGRLSDLIIRGGSNVSPGEIETVLRAHAAVQDAAVVGAPDPTYGQAVVAVVVPTATGHIDLDELAGWCRSQLAGYKVPTRFVVTDGLPVSPATGKVDRGRVLAELSATEGAA